MCGRKYEPILHVNGDPVYPSTAMVERWHWLAAYLSGPTSREKKLEQWRWLGEYERARVRELMDEQ